MYILPYQREKALAYAKTWAFSRNPAYYPFDEIGGDCTNFISQCLYSGSNKMNPTPVTGWYYYSLNNRSASWTSVNYFYQFLTTNKGNGPFGHISNLEDLLPGDIIQLATEHDYFHHTVIVISTDHTNLLQNISISAHNNDAYMRPLDTYAIKQMRCISIDGI